MTEALSTFFDAWSIGDPDERRAKIAEAMAEHSVYSDPRSGGRLTGIDAIAEYVGNFSANAEGWRASIEKHDGMNGFVRAVVKFSGPVPDKGEIAQFGTYFADHGEDQKIVSLAGFVGAEIE